MLLTYKTSICVSFMLQEQGLYYDGNSGTYYYYDKEKNTFLFHSQVAASQVSTVDTSVNTNLVIASKKRVSEEVNIIEVNIYSQSFRKYQNIVRFESYSILHVHRTRAITKM